MGRKSNTEQPEYIQEKKSFIEINTDTQARDEQNDNLIPGTNMIDAESKIKTTSVRKEQIHKEQLKLSDKLADDLIIEKNTETDKIFPVADKKLKPAKAQKEFLRSAEDTDSVFGVEDSFSAIREEDGKYMKQVKSYMAQYLRTPGIYEQKDILDNLISACRWYNATHWSYFGKSGKRLKDVKTILAQAQKERKTVIKRIDEEEKKRVNRRIARDQRVEDRFDKEKLIVRKRANEESRFFDDVTDQRPVQMSKYWAIMKAYTVGLFGRNILNLGMGAIAGTAWLASYPIARMIGAATGKAEYKKGFNIRIPHPQSAKKWLRYYMYSRRHVGNTISRYLKRPWIMPLVVAGKFIQYDIWDPFKHLITFDVNHLSGGAYFGKDTKREAIKDRADADYRSAAAPVDDDYEDDEDVEDITIDPAVQHYAANMMA